MGRTHRVLPKQFDSVRRTHRNNPKASHPGRRSPDNSSPSPGNNRASPGNNRAEFGEHRASPLRHCASALGKRRSPVRNRASLRTFPMRPAIADRPSHLSEPAFTKTPDMLRDLPMQLRQVAAATRRRAADRAPPTANTSGHPYMIVLVRPSMDPVHAVMERSSRDISETLKRGIVADHSAERITLRRGAGDERRFGRCLYDGGEAQ